MAYAVKHEKIPDPPPYTVTLELSQNEAEVLRVVVGGISGSIRGPRRFTDAIYSALTKAGVAPVDGAHSNLNIGYVNMRAARFFDASGVDL